MSLSRLAYSAQSAIIGLWSLTEQYDVLLQRVIDLGFDTSAQLGYKSELKQQQWLAARCLLKEMDQTINEVFYNEQGAPNLDNGVHVSLSHSHHMVAAIVDKNENVGIDIQHLSPKIGHIKEKFCSKKELDWSSGPDQLERLHVIWSTKEAVYKWARKSGLIFKDEILLEPFNMVDKGELDVNVHLKERWLKLKLYYEILDEYTLAYTLNP